MRSVIQDVPSHRILRLGRTSLNPQISGLSLEAKLKTEEDVQKTDFSTKLYNEARTILQETVCLFGITLFLHYFSQL